MSAVSILGSLEADLMERGEPDLLEPLEPDLLEPQERDLWERPDLLERSPSDSLSP